MIMNRKLYRAAAMLAVLNLVFAMILLFVLPSEIKIGFSFILTSGAAFGSKFYILSLPALVFVVLGLWHVSRKYYDTLIDGLLSIITFGSIIISFFFLLQSLFL